MYSKYGIFSLNTFGALRAISITCKLAPTSPNTLLDEVCVCVKEREKERASVFSVKVSICAKAVLTLSKDTNLPCCCSYSLRLDTEIDRKRQKGSDSILHTDFGTFLIGKKACHQNQCPPMRPYNAVPLSSHFGTEAVRTG